MGKEGFVKPWAEIPIVALVILVAIKSPDAADDDEGTNAIVPKIAEIMKTQVGAGIGSLEPDVIVND
jgi:hypothetical protein